MEKELRLDKYLADMGKGTRSQIRAAVRSGRVGINGITAAKPDQKIRPGEDEVSFDGRPVAYIAAEYYMMNKPAGVLSATEDRKRRTVLDLLDQMIHKDLAPVGRLDLDTEGLLLITNDGALAHRLLAPKNHVDKVYFARCAGRVPESAAAEFEAGLRLPDGLVCLPAKLEILGYLQQTGTECSAGSELQDETEWRTEPERQDETEWRTEPERQDKTERRTKPAWQAEPAWQTEIRLTIHEGKFHQVKRMMEAVGCPVLYLKRLSMGPLVLDAALGPGEYRPLTKEELELLQRL